MLKVFLSALADLFDAWKDGSNDPGDLQAVSDAVVDVINGEQAVSDAVVDVINGEFDEEIDSLLGKPFVGTALGFLAGVLRSLGD
jgi:hypothetical protein